MSIKGGITLCLFNEGNTLHLRVAYYTYLGEEIETPQAADNAVDLREPSAFTTGL